MSAFNHTRIIVPVTAALALVLSGCATSILTRPTPTSTLSAVQVAPHVTLSAPPTIAAKAPVTLVVDSSGHDGETAKLYAFPVIYDGAANCADTTVNPTTVTITGGTQTVTLDPFQTGQDVYWVLTGTGFGSDCGASKTRILTVPFVGIVDNMFTKEVGRKYNGMEAVSVTLSSADVGDYTVAGWFPPMASVPAFAVVWAGPFSTAPEANASPCPVTPVAWSNTVPLTTDGTLNAAGEQYSTAGLPVPVTVPGIYRVLVSAPATDYTVASPAVCETAFLVIIQ
ncbi:MAG: hypothetical protein FWF25_01345 [Propionibacteriaceae bacterium]|nr:hypothetical protein [Propionibacteriaceae bacterium]